MDPKEVSCAIPLSPDNNVGLTKRVNVVSMAIEPPQPSMAQGVASSVLRRKSGINRNNLFTRDQAPTKKKVMSIRQNINTEASIQTTTAVCDVTQESKKVKQSFKTLPKRKDGYKPFIVNSKSTAGRKSNKTQEKEKSLMLDKTMKSSIKSVKKMETTFDGETEDVPTGKNRSVSKPSVPTTTSLTMEDKVLDNLDFAELLDRHYIDIQPGVHRIKYTPSEIRTVCAKATQMLAGESPLIDIRAGLYVCGDIHGQFNDLINMFIILGRPPTARYCFLGDYVDRGGMSLECIVMLLAYKVLYPKHVFLLRGNHECARVNKKYGFMEELEKIFGMPYAQTCWAIFQRVFNFLPVGAIIEKKIICMHGGLSPLMYNLDDVRKEAKPIRNPSKGLINDMLWADPQHDINFWRTSLRGSGFCFGDKVIDELLCVNSLELILRAHQLCMDGFWFFHDRKLVTIFSAPAYCNMFRNASAALRIDKDLKCKMVTFIPDGPGVAEMVETRQTLFEAPPSEPGDPLSAPISTKPLPQSCS